MNKILSNMEKFVDSEDVLKDVYGVSSNNEYDYVIITPNWNLDKINGDNKIEYTEITNNRYAQIYDLKINNKKILYVILQIGSPNIVDFCLACYKLKCENYIFMGSVGAIVKGISIGDCVIPSVGISGNGSTMFLSENIKEKFLENTYSNNELNNRLIKVCRNKGFNVLDEKIISVDTIFAEYTHLDKFRELGAKLIDMETASFFESINIIGKKGSALLLVSDNSANGEHLISNNEESFKNFVNNRSKIFGIITEL